MLIGLQALSQLPAGGKLALGEQNWFLDKAQKGSHPMGCQRSKGTPKNVRESARFAPSTVRLIDKV